MTQSSLMKSLLTTNLNRSSTTNITAANTTRYKYVIIKMVYESIFVTNSRSTAIAFPGFAHPYGSQKPFIRNATPEAVETKKVLLYFLRHSSIAFLAAGACSRGRQEIPRNSQTRRNPTTVRCLRIQLSRACVN